MIRNTLLIFSFFAIPLISQGHTFLQILAEPGAEIFIDNNSQGKTNWKDSGLNLKISPGSYEVVAKKPGFESQQTTVSLEKGDVELWKLAPFRAVGNSSKAASAEEKMQAAKPGTLVIYTFPKQCEITLVSPSSEKSWKKTKTQWKAQKLPAGEYTAKATAGGRTLSYDIEIPAGGGVELVFNFRNNRTHLRNVFEAER